MRWIIYVWGASCCLPPSPDVTLRQVAQKRVYVEVKATVFPQVPATPAATKWTKLAPVCDLLILRFLMHGIFPRVFATLQVASSGAAADIDMSMDFDMIRDVFFSAVAGSTFKCSSILVRPSYLPCSGHAWINAETVAGDHFLVHETSPRG